MPCALQIPSENEDVLAAATLGVVAGTGYQKFSPGLFITREQAAVMLHKACLLFEVTNEKEPPVFLDEMQISEWAIEAINFVSSVESGPTDGRLMQGVSDTRFDPQGYFTVEQSITTFINLISTL